MIPHLPRAHFLHLAAAATLIAACGTSTGPTDSGAPDTSSQDAALDSTAADSPVGDSSDLDSQTMSEAGDARADAADAAPMPVPVTASTSSGDVIGRTVGAISSFLGIPYAAPPLGDLRWRPPASPAAWATPRDASMRGLACPQPPDALSGMSVPQSEDCLTLNVWTPQVADTAHLPVMFFIHGGGFTSGSGVDPLYDGANLAQRGNVVVVTINYRLGQLGFLAHSSLEDPAHNNSAGNYGLMDQQFAMQWVRDNITHFGGDPANVTIFGESAGAISVCSQMVSPLSTGLFRRAIGESGPCTFITTQLKTDPTGQETAEALGARFATALGCNTAADVAACMRAKPVSDVLNAVPMGIELQRGHASYQPIIDGYVFTEAPWASFTAGRIHPVGYLSGTNRDEGTAFVLGTTIGSDQAYTAAVAALVPGHENDVTQTLYPVANYNGDYNAAMAAFITDAVFACPARAQSRLTAAAQTAPDATYLYQFIKETNFGRTFGIGVFHSSELPFVFGNFISPFRASDDPMRTVSNAMIGYWSRFAATGDPNGAGAVAWPAYTAAGDDYLEIDTTITAKRNLKMAQCDTLETWF